jgi:hypothetical protein
MATSLSGRWLSRRALLAALGLLVLVLQTLAPPAARHATALQAGASAVSGVCAPHDDDRAPPPAHGDHTPCCLSCVAGRDGPPMLPAELPAGEAKPASSAFRLAYGAEDAPDGRPIGWASSWSSRAPPRA